MPLEEHEVRKLAQDWFEQVYNSVNMTITERVIAEFGYFCGYRAAEKAAEQQ